MFFAIKKIRDIIKWKKMHVLIINKLDNQIKSFD